MTIGQYSTSFARLTLAGAVFSLAVTGCLSPITLNRAVTSYDEAITDLRALSRAKQGTGPEPGCGTNPAPSPVEPVLRRSSAGS